MNLGFQITYLSEEGILRPRTEWMRCESRNVDKLTVTGHNLHTGEPVTVSICLVHTTANPNESV
jgi:hypothetical protein